MLRQLCSFAVSSGGAGQGRENDVRGARKGQLLLLGLVSLVGAAACGSPQMSSPAAVVSSITAQPTTAVPTAIVVQAPTVAPHTVAPTARPAVAPTQRPTAPPRNLCGAPPNPWNYNFCGGGTISSPPSNLCDFFNCIASFWQSTKGYVEECQDGTYSHSGGRSGSCSSHGGNLRPLDL
jgi:hypothetical protein